MHPFIKPEVQGKFASYPPEMRKKMLALRELVWRTAAATPLAGPIEETLKWGEPAYVTSNGAGSTVRMDWKAKTADAYALYFNCNTTLVETFRNLFPTELKFEGQRAIVMGLNDRLPREALAFCIAAAMTYHVKHPEHLRFKARQGDA